jgi:hypothetical protein
MRRTASTTRRPPRPEAVEPPFEWQVDEAAPAGNVVAPLASLLLSLARNEPADGATCPERREVPSRGKDRGLPAPSAVFQVEQKKGKGPGTRRYSGPGAASEEVYTHGTRAQHARQARTPS